MQLVYGLGFRKQMTDMSHGCSQGLLPYWGKNKWFTTRGIPITQTIRRYPLDTYLRDGPQCWGHSKGSRPRCRQDQDTWGKTKTSNKNKTSHLARLKNNMVEAWHPPIEEVHGDIFMSLSVVNFKLIKIISNQLEYPFLLLYLQLNFDYFRLRSLLYNTPATTTSSMHHHTSRLTMTTGGQENKFILRRVLRSSHTTMRTIFSESS